MASGSKSSAWDVDSLLAIHTALVDKTRDRFDMPEFVKISRIFLRKHVQVVFFFKIIGEWEKISLQKYGRTSTYEENRKLFADTAKLVYLPSLESYYKCKIDYFYLLKPHYKNNVMYSFSVKFFEVPLFKSVDSFQSAWEEKLANSFSARYRQQNGRGPSKVTAAILGERFLVIEVVGLLGAFPQRYLAMHIEAMPVLVDLITSQIRDAIEFAWEECYSNDKECETFQEVDLPNNRCVVLIITEALTEKDFLES